MKELNINDVSGIKAHMNKYGPNNSCSLYIGNSRLLGYYELKEIVYAHEHGVDVSLLVDPGNERFQFDFYQMVEIIKGVENHVDISVYRDVKYDSTQMYWIRLGLEKYGHVNYDHPCIFADIMEHMFHGDWNISRKEALKMSYQWHPSFWEDVINQDHIRGLDLRELREAIKNK